MDVLRAEDPHSPSPTATRTDRRKARTRAALVRAAQQLLAEGRPDVSIQEITDTADVGFGSFYNHFTDKAELFEVAASDLLRQHGDLVERLTADLDDPAEVFCVGVRLTGRMSRVFPAMARVAVRAGTRYVFVDDGLAAFARRDVEAATRSGRFDATDTSLALAMVGGSVIGLLALLDADPTLDAAALSDQLAERVLRAFGLPRAEAADLAHRPLPPLPVLELGPASAD